LDVGHAPEKSCLARTIAQGVGVEQQRQNADFTRQMMDRRMDNATPNSGLSHTKIRNVRSTSGEWTFQLSLDAWEHLQLIDSTGNVYPNVNVIPLFPVTSPHEGISILSEDQEELLCIGSISELPAEYRELLQSELSLREFVPVIQRVLSVSGKTEPCEWVVDTNHGRTSFVLKTEEDVHRISNQTVNFLDANGMRYRVENLNALDRKSKAFIEWYV
jgi:hypothetical protein